MGDINHASDMTSCVPSVLSSKNEYLVSYVDFKYKGIQIYPDNDLIDPYYTRLWHTKLQSVISTSIHNTESDKQIIFYNFCR